eukprot:9504028-Pyramimonas_sp.AAC.1
MVVGPLGIFRDGTSHAGNSTSIVKRLASSAQGLQRFLSVWQRTDYLLVTGNSLGMVQDQLGSVYGRYWSFPELFMGGAGFTGSSTWAVQDKLGTP